jgi:hypothetical protein
MKHIKLLCLHTQRVFLGYFRAFGKNIGTDFQAEHRCTESMKNTRRMFFAEGGQMKESQVRARFYLAPAVD